MQLRKATHRLVVKIPPGAVAASGAAGAMAGAPESLCHALLCPCAQQTLSEHAPDQDIPAFQSKSLVHFPDCSGRTDAQAARLRCGKMIMQDRESRGEPAGTCENV